MADQKMSDRIPTNRSRLPKSLESVARALLRRISIRGSVTYGRNLRMGRGSSLSSLHGLVVGDSVSIGRRTIVEVDGSIGSFCLIGQGVQIVGRVDHDMGQVGVPMALSTWVGDRERVPQDAVEIGADVWIGGGAIVLGGTTIGHGAVIGAGAVVVNDIEPFGIAVGNPARVVKLRFDSIAEREEHIERIRKM
jgi:acetyltransferase-like isoleucine patch superfamily enzyme